MTGQLLRARDLAETLGIAETTAYKLIESGAIETVRIGRSVRVTPAAVEAYIRRNTTPVRPALRSARRSA